MRCLEVLGTWDLGGGGHEGFRGFGIAVELIGLGVEGVAGRYAKLDLFKVWGFYGLEGLGFKVEGFRVSRGLYLLRTARTRKTQTQQSGIAMMAPNKKQRLMGMRPCCAWMVVSGV